LIIEGQKAIAAKLGFSAQKL